MTDPAWIIYKCRVLLFGKYPDGISGKKIMKRGRRRRMGKCWKKEE
jgi:hypothetical protein